MKNLQYFLFTILFLTACSIKCESGDKLCECKSKCYNPYAGFAGSNVALFVIGESIADNCRKKCENDKSK